MTRTVKCPTCGKQVAWIKQAKWKPFCSERCRLIDLGEWASESHRIPSDTTVPEELIEQDKNKQH